MKNCIHSLSGRQQAFLCLVFTLVLLCCLNANAQVQTYDVTVHQGVPQAYGGAAAAASHGEAVMRMIDWQDRKRREQLEEDSIRQKEKENQEAKIQQQTASGIDSFNALMHEARAAKGATQDELIEALAPLAKLVDKSWPSFNYLVEYREKQYNIILDRVSHGDDTIKKTILNDSKQMRELQRMIDAQTVIQISANTPNNFPEGLEMRGEAESALKNIIYNHSH